MHDDSQKAFDDWKADAAAVSLLEEARARGAKLKRTGVEWAGPCPLCGGTDRFAVNPKKNVFVCRGAAGGGVIDLVMHLARVDFLGACEMLTQRPPPRGKSKPLSEQEIKELDQKRAARAEETRQREAEEARRVAKKAATAAEIWRGVEPIAGTLGEIYLNAEGIPTPPMGWPDCLGFAPSLHHELADEFFPAVVARVDDCGGALTAIWREFISEDGKRKARVEPSKLGLGPAAGGAVRIGGVASKTGVAEGLKTALAAWTIERYRFPVWAALSTSGMAGFEIPLEIDHLPIYPDSDLPRRNKEGEMMEDWTPPGLRAAQMLQSRATEVGVSAPIQELPFLPGKDFRDVLKACTVAEGNL